jgi:hypothetical protein
MSIRASARQRQSLPILDPSICRGYADQLLAGASQSLIPPESIHPTIDYLQSMLVECVTTKDYLQAQKIEDICTALLQERTEYTYESYQQCRLKSLEERLDAALEAVDEVRQVLQESQSMLEKERCDALQNLIADNEQELVAFDEAHLREMPAAFRKFSREYLLLRKRQESCVHSKRFSEANALKLEADEFEAIETTRQEENWHKSVALQREALQHRQMQKIQVLEEKFRCRWCEQILPLLNELTGAENAVKAAELKLSTFQAGENGPAPMKTGGPINGKGTRMRTLNYTAKRGKLKCKPVRKLLGVL